MLSCSIDTLERWCKRTYDKGFADIFEDKKSRGKVSLRRLQWKLAEKSPAMAIFLGKNYLSQRDEQDVKLKGKIGSTTLAELMMEDYDGADTNAQGTEV